MKKCFKCGIEKSIGSFYKHQMMGDGHLNKCIDCTKSDVKIRADKLKENPEWIEQERARGRDKYHRLNYRVTKPIKKSVKKKAMKIYGERYPEKYRAKCRCKVKRTIEGSHLHHWNYGSGYESDIIELLPRDHYLLHRHMIYDQSEFMYRDSKGNLLDSKESHIELLKKIKE